MKKRTEGRWKRRKAPLAPPLAAGLSVLPGLGHLALGEKGKAAALFATDLGILLSSRFMKSAFGFYLILFIYGMVMVPAVIETYKLARGTQSRLSESRPYIVLLLFVTGFAALPLLWHSGLFTKRAKIVWSVAVSVLAILYFSLLGFFGAHF